MSGLRSVHAGPGESPGLALWRATNTWQRVVRAALAPHDLTHVQFVLLATLTWLDGAPTTQRELATQAGADVMMTSQVVRALEGKGLVERRPNPDDARAVLVAPTAAGAALANVANVDVEAADEAFFGRLDPDAEAVLLASLNRLGIDRA